MAFSKVNLSRMLNGASNQAGQTFGVYQLVTADAPTVVETAGYFGDDAAQTFTEGTGDILLAVMDTDGTPVARTYSVTRADKTIALTAAS